MTRIVLTEMPDKPTLSQYLDELPLTLVSGEEVMLFDGLGVDSYMATMLGSDLSHCKMKVSASVHACYRLVRMWYSGELRPMPRR